jgi:hypothetical protein
VKLETGKYSTAVENKPAMMYANTMKNKIKKALHFFSNFYQ